MKIILSLLFISLLAFSLASGQEKKDRNTVKVIIADKSGTKVIVDTTYTDKGINDSIILKNGKVIVIGNEEFEIEDEPGGSIEVFAHVDSEGKKTEHKYVYINDGKVLKHSDGEAYNVIISERESDTDVDRTSYVIAKNGITVTIEGTDESRIKELIEEIEKKLEMNENESESDKAENKDKNKQ